MHDVLAFFVVFKLPLCSDNLYTTESPVSCVYIYLYTIFLGRRRVVVFLYKFTHQTTLEISSVCRTCSVLIQRQCLFWSHRGI